MKKPVIGISAVTAFNDMMFSQRVTYPQAIWAAGGDAILLPCAPNTENCERIVSMIDGLLVPGGFDIEPTIYGEEKLPECGTTFPSEDAYDMALIKEAVKQGKPVMCICRGCQIANVLYGGTLYQDLPTQYGKTVEHSKGDIPGIINTHPVKLEADSYLAKVLGATNIITNTAHHQAVKDLGKGFKIVGRAEDGTIEAIEQEDGSIIAMQWHPEMLQNVEMYRNLFIDFIKKSSDK